LFSRFSNLRAADFSGNIRDIFSSGRAVQKEIQLEHIVERFFQVYLGKEFYFYLILEKDFI